jgi:hypothetical protein
LSGQIIQVELQNRAVQYFQQNFGIDSEMINATIYRVMANFKPRKGQIVRTQELWQKVGLVLEQQYQIYPLN